MHNFCDKCGAELKEGVKFCDKCGNKISGLSNNAGTTYSCPYCGEKIPFATKCPKCGNSLKNNDAAKAGLTIIGIIILIIIIPGICGFILLLWSGG